MKKGDKQYKAAMQFLELLWWPLLKKKKRTMAKKTIEKSNEELVNISIEIINYVVRRLSHRNLTIQDAMTIVAAVVDGIAFFISNSHGIKKEALLLEFQKFLFVYGKDNIKGGKVSGANRKG